MRPFMFTTRSLMTIGLVVFGLAALAQTEVRTTLNQLQQENRQLSQTLYQISDAVDKDKHKVMEPLLHEVMERIESMQPLATALPPVYAAGVASRTTKLRERAGIFEGFVHKSSFLDKDKKLSQAFDNVKATNDDLTTYLSGVAQDLARLEKVSEPAPQSEVADKPSTQSEVADKPSPARAVFQTSETSLVFIREAVIDIQNRIDRIGKYMKRNQFGEIAKEAKELGLSALKIKNLSLLLDEKRKATAESLSPVLYQQADQLHHLAHKGKATHHRQHEAFETLEKKAQLLFSAME